MALNLFSGTTIALSIENGSLRLLVVRRGRVQSWMSYGLDSDVFKDGLVLSPTVFQTALSSLFFVRDSIRGDISVCFPGNRSFFRTVNLPRFKPQLMAEAMQREAQRELPVNREDVHLLWEPFGPPQDDQDFLLVGMQKDAYGRLHSAMKGAKLRPRMWDLHPLALVRAVGRKNVVIADVAPGATEIIVVTDGVPRLVRSVVEPAELEPAQQGQALAEHVAKTVAYYLANRPDDNWDPRTAVVLTGPLAGGIDLAQAFRGASAYPLEPFNCPIPCPPDFTPAMYAATLGLAMKSRHASWIGRNPEAFDMLGGAVRSKALPAKRAAVAMSLLVGVALLAPSVQAKQRQQEQLTARTATLATVQSRLAQSRQDLTERAQLEKTIQDTKLIADSLREERDSIIAKGRDLSGEIATLQAVAPDALNLHKFLTVDRSLVAEGLSPDPETVLEYARSVERTGRFQSVAITSIRERANRDNTTATAFVLTVSSAAS